MKTNNMNERITFYSLGTGVINGVPINNKKITQFTCWAEVSKMPLRDFKNNIDKVGYTREQPVFVIAFKQKKEIQMNWRINWRGKDYTIEAMNPDYATKDINTVSGKLVK